MAIVPTRPQRGQRLPIQENNFMPLVPVLFYIGRANSLASASKSPLSLTLRKISSPMLPSFKLQSSPSPHRPMALKRTTPASSSPVPSATSSPKPLFGSPLLFSVTAGFEDEDEDSISGSESEEKETETETETSVELDVEEEDITTMDFDFDLKGFPAAGVSRRNSKDGVGQEEKEKVEEVKEDVKPKRTKDSVYFLEMIVFQIEDTLFRLPTHLIRSCTTFFDDLIDELGSTAFEHDKVIERDDVKISDFRALLQFILPMSVSMTRTLTDDEWISVLKVSTKWKMFDIRRMAINHLTSASIPLVDRIVLARECCVPSWLLSSYKELLDSKSILSTLTRSEMELIGLETVFKLHRARELAFPFNMDLLDRSTAKVQKEFAVELETLKDIGAVERANLAKEYNVREWWIDALVDLMKRDECLTVEEAQNLGFKATVGVFKAREIRSSKGMMDALVEVRRHHGELKIWTALERLSMGRKYGMRAWVEEALISLAMQSKSLSVPEAHEIGLETAISICVVRHVEDRPPLVDDTRQSRLEEEFAEEFSRMKQEGSQLLSPQESQLLQEQPSREDKDPQPASSLSAMTTRNPFDNVVLGESSSALHSATNQPMTGEPFPFPSRGQSPPQQKHLQLLPSTPHPNPTPQQSTSSTERSTTAPFKFSFDGLDSHDERKMVKLRLKSRPWPRPRPRG